MTNLEQIKGELQVLVERQNKINSQHYYVNTKLSNPDPVPTAVDERQEKYQPQAPGLLTDISDLVSELRAGLNYQEVLVRESEVFVVGETTESAIHGGVMVSNAGRTEL